VLAFKIFEEKLKKDQLAKKRALNTPSKQKSKQAKNNNKSKNDYEGSNDESSQNKEESEIKRPDEECIAAISECNQDAVISKSNREGGVTRSIKVIFTFLGDNLCQVKLIFVFFSL
jgi:hypothetical protein